LNTDGVLISRMHKPQVHLHLEGAIRPQTLLELAAEHRVGDFPYHTVDEIKLAARVERGQGLTRFIDQIQGFPLRFVFTKSSSIQRIAYEAVEDEHKSRVTYMEMMVGPHKPGGLPPAQILREVLIGAKAAGRKYRMHAYIIAAINRKMELESAWEVARAAVSHHRNGVVALALVGDENKYPAAAFKEVFLWALNQHGMPSVQHALEGNGRVAEGMKQVMASKASAIDHGVQLYKYRDLERQVADQKLPMRMCPTPNDLLGVEPIESFPIRHYLQLGIPVSLGTDDPFFFGTTLNGEYRALRDRLGLTDQEVIQVAYNGFAHGFAPKGVKERLIEQFKQSLLA